MAPGGLGLRETMMLASGMNATRRAPQNDRVPSVEVTL
jgi:hypothetical protein